ncbi:MAG: ATPase, T2SS/T4P/T4SS family [Kiritimatiellaeota bacterium]|nr:ATPase, T2SS/T4P/T4SS family [Kiritimatiellota bacterium]
MAEIDGLIRQLVEAGGSDLHLSPQRCPRIRKSGDIAELAQPVMSAEDTRRVIFEIMPERCRQEFEERNDADFSYEIPGLARLRVNAFRDRFGPGAVLRAIPSKVITVEELQLPAVIPALCALPKGLVIVTGPTGCGKSTTLAAMIDYINRTRTGHIITIEDPIEFVHEDKRCLVNQREVATHTRSFAAALRAALREDPNIVLLGEMRDLETMEIVERIVNAFPADRQNQIRAMLASSLKGVIAQTLCRRKRGGRVAALEILVVDWGVAALIRDAKTFQIPSAMQVGRHAGMCTLNDSLLALVQADLITPEEAYANTLDREDLSAKMKKIGLLPPELGRR